MKMNYVVNILLLINLLPRNVKRHVHDETYFCLAFFSSPVQNAIDSILGFGISFISSLLISSNVICLFDD